MAAAAALLVASGAGRASAEEALAPADFAWGRTIEVERADPLQTVLLDLAVYRGAVSPDLADLRVFNAAGEVVPHAIRALVDPREEEGARIAVPLFRLPDGRTPALIDAAATASGRRLVRTRDVEIELSGDGTIVRVAPADPASPAEGPPETYLVDLSRLDEAIVGLELDLGETPAEFVVPMRVEASDDLVHFRTLPTRSALARLAQSGHRIERSEIELPAVSGGYLRLSSAAEPLPVEVRAARARVAPASQAPPRQRARIAGARVPGDAEAFVYDLGGAVPVDRIQVDFAVANTVVEADLLSSAAADGPWVPRFSGVLYELARSDGGELRSPEVELRPARDRYFQLVVAAKGGGAGEAPPELDAAWYPEQLLFVARGEGPFAIGYGRAEVEASRFEAGTLIRTVLAPDAEVPRETAALGPVRPVAGPAVLEPSRVPEPATIGLWAALVACVVAVLAMSARLLRRMDRPEDGPPPQ